MTVFYNFVFVICFLVVAMILSVVVMWKKHIPTGMITAILWMSVGMNRFTVSTSMVTFEGITGIFCFLMAVFVAAYPFTQRPQAHQPYTEKTEEEIEQEDDDRKKKKTDRIRKGRGINNEEAI